MTSPRKLIEKSLATLRVLRGKRRYPIKRDERGLSARSRAFDLFDLDLRPKEVSKKVGISPATACRYYQSWKKAGGKNFRALYGPIAHNIKKNLEVSDAAIQTLAEYYGISPQEIIVLAQKPWGVMRLLKGEWPNRRLDKLYKEQDKRLYSALKWIRILEAIGEDIELISEVMDRVADQVKRAGEDRSQTT